MQDGSEKINKHQKNHMLANSEVFNALKKQLQPYFKGTGIEDQEITLAAENLINDLNNKTINNLTGKDATDVAKKIVKNMTFQTKKEDKPLTLILDEALKGKLNSEFEKDFTPEERFNSFMESFIENKYKNVPQLTQGVEKDQGLADLKQELHNNKITSKTFEKLEMEEAKSLGEEIGGQLGGHNYGSVKLLAVSRGSKIEQIKYSIKNIKLPKLKILSKLSKEKTSVIKM